MWECVKKQNDPIKHLFKKFSLFYNLEGCQDALINIKGIECYKMYLPEQEFQTLEETDSEDDHDDDFGELSLESHLDSE